MTENEIILVDQISDNIYDSLIDKCIKYAIISKPFTIRRVDNQSLERAILNIFKGKLAEALFQYFCIQNKIILDWDTCSTPFWQVDQRDFILYNKEWDIKNNFLYHSSDILPNYNYIDLPCLIPNRRQGDQWTSRNEIKNDHISLEGVAYVFSFLKSADLSNGVRGPDFYSLNISKNQLNFIDQLERKYSGLPADAEPFTDEWFWEEMKKKGSLSFSQLYFRPYLIITGYASSEHWNLFKDTGPFDRNHNYRDYKEPEWYFKARSGSCGFLNGTIWATITNATVPVSYLPSFSSLFPQLKDSIRCARFMT